MSGPTRGRSTTSCGAIGRRFGIEADRDLVST